jgi:DNA polymerase I-like protein with 3'-5' exonuclease and polymerase domains
LGAVDLPDLSRYKDSVAIDTETMGLNPHRDRLCVVQMSNGDGIADVIQIPKGHSDAPNLKALLANPAITKIFHFARFDLAALYNAFGVMPKPVYCTKIASRLARTYTDRHGLKDLVREVLNVDLSKQQQSSDWGSQSSAPRQSTENTDVLQAASQCLLGVFVGSPLCDIPAPPKRHVRRRRGPGRGSKAKREVATPRKWTARRSQRRMPWP